MRAGPAGPEPIAGAETFSVSFSRRSFTIALLAIGACGLLLRLFRLGVWSVSGDEVYTVFDAFSSKAGSVQNFPLSYLLTKLSLALAPLDPTEDFELAMRLPHAIIGTISILLFPWLVARIVSRRIAIVLALLICFSPWLIFQSQFARYYATLFLASALAGVSFFLAVESRSKRAWLGVAIGIIVATAAHPTALLILPAFALDRLCAHRNSLVLQSPRTLVIGMGVTALLITLGYFYRDTVLWNLRLRKEGVEGVIDIMQGLIYNFGIHLVGIGALAFPLVVRRHAALVRFLLLWILVPTAAVLALAACSVPVGHRYLIVALPGAFWLIALGIGEIVREIARRDRVAAGLVVFITIALFGPSIVSHFEDGNHHDYRGVATWLKENVGPRDMIVSEQHALVARYAGWDDSRIVELPPQAGQDQPITTEQLWHRVWSAKRLWVVIPDEKLRSVGWEGVFSRWALGRLRVSRIFHASRLDYHQNILWVLYRAP